MQTFDANLLIVLDTLLDTGSVTRSAERLNISISAMSRTLTRIRKLMKDPILVQAGRQYVLTPKALELRARLHAHAQEARSLVYPEPASLLEVERTLTIGTEETLIARFGMRITEAVRVKAPKAIVRFTTRVDEPVGALREGIVDLELGHLNIQGPEIKLQTLFTDKFVGIARANHPLCKGRITILRYVEFPHVSVSRRGNQWTPIDEELAKADLRRDVALIVPTFSTAVASVIDSDWISAVLEHHLPANIVEAFHLQKFALPVSLPSLRISQGWHPRFDADPLHRYLRECVASTCRRMLDSEALILKTHRRK